MSVEETFLPKVETVNSISDVQTTDRKALVIRLELDYVEYAAMEDLHKVAIDSMQERLDQISSLLEEVKSGGEIVSPLTVKDLERVYIGARDDMFRAQALATKVKRNASRAQCDNGRS